MMRPRAIALRNTHPEQLLQYLMSSKETCQALVRIIYRFRPSNNFDSTKKIQCVLDFPCPTDQHTTGAAGQTPCGMAAVAVSIRSGNCDGKEERGEHANDWIL
ncbi:hypothetical protein EVAR_36639_1 [Eumeta japonica]|uniref:Uncharacterized protein n=1 Tax=Eumeta variegata TaxID=151549 RepID=A0A4C1YK77_EUMVA|nr:hypothetical protein EVAR_36639_1 [Eumeta japonica]